MEWEKYRAGLQVMHNKLENTKSSNAMEMYKNVSKTCSELRDKNYQKKKKL